MTLDEAIKHAEEVARENREIYETRLKVFTKEAAENVVLPNCLKCAEEHEQLVEWLKELKGYREGTRTCEFCKYEDKTEIEFPCSVCRYNHTDKFEPKGKEK